MYQFATFNKMTDLRIITHDDLSIDPGDIACFYKDGRTAIKIVFKSDWTENRYWHFKDSNERDEKFNKLNTLLGATIL